MYSSFHELNATNSDRSEANTLLLNPGGSAFPNSEQQKSTVLDTLKEMIASRYRTIPPQGDGDRNNVPIRLTNTTKNAGSRV
jgi:hypothetical protein